MNEPNGAEPDIVRPSPGPFTVRVTNIPGGLFSIQFFTTTGALVVFADRELLKSIGQMFVTHATGIVLPNEGAT